METVSRVQVLDVAVCFSHSANPFEKSMQQTILPSAMGKQLGSLTLVCQPV